MDGAPGIRLPMNEDLFRCTDGGSTLAHMAGSLLPGAHPVRYIAFNKTPDVNWQVPWHQDRVIAVQERHPVDGFDHWSLKAGTWHVEPRIDLLRDMIFARVHLDDTDERNGCLELALGTHRNGRIPADAATDIAASAPIEVCRAHRGDVIFAKSLLLHRSQPSINQTERCTLRVDFCAWPLPKPLAWAYQTPLSLR